MGTSGLQEFGLESQEQKCEVSSVALESAAKFGFRDSEVSLGKGHCRAGIDVTNTSLIDSLHVPLAAGVWFCCNQCSTCQVGNLTPS